MKTLNQNNTMLLWNENMNFLDNHSYTWSFSFVKRSSCVYLNHSLQEKKKCVPKNDNQLISLSFKCKLSEINVADDKSPDKSEIIKFK